MDPLLVRCGHVLGLHLRPANLFQMWVTEGEREVGGQRGSRNVACLCTFVCMLFIKQALTKKGTSPLDNTSSEVSKTAGLNRSPNPPHLAARLWRDSWRTTSQRLLIVQNQPECCFCNWSWFSAKFSHHPKPGSCRTRASVLFHHLYLRGYFSPYLDKSRTLASAVLCDAYPQTHPWHSPQSIVAMTLNHSLTPSLQRTHGERRRGNRLWQNWLASGPQVLKHILLHQQSASVCPVFTWILPRMWMVIFTCCRLLVLFNKVVCFLSND